MYLCLYYDVAGDWGVCWVEMGVGRCMLRHSRLPR